MHQPVCAAALVCGVPLAPLGPPPRRTCGARRLPLGCPVPLHLFPFTPPCVSSHLSSFPAPCPPPSHSRATCTCSTNFRPAGRRAASCGGRPASERARGRRSRWLPNKRASRAGPVLGRLPCPTNCPSPPRFPQPNHPSGWSPQPHSHPTLIQCSNLFDVFVNIRDDELEHVKTMEACQIGSVALDLQVGCAAGDMTIAPVWEWVPGGWRHAAPQVPALCRALLSALLGGSRRPGLPRAHHRTPTPCRTCKAWRRQQRSRTSLGWRPGPPLMTRQRVQARQQASGCRPASSRARHAGKPFIT